MAKGDTGTLSQDQNQEKSSYEKLLNAMASSSNQPTMQQSQPMGLAPSTYPVNPEVNRTIQPIAPTTQPIPTPTPVQPNPNQNPNPNPNQPTNPTMQNPFAPTNPIGPTNTAEILQRRKELGY